MEPYKILIVCLGNICRSPMAEVIMKSRVEAMTPKRQINVGSAGFLHSGEPASQPAEVVMNERQIDLTKHLSRQLSPYLVQQHDLVLTMEEEQAGEIIHMGAGDAHVESIISYASKGKESGNVFDPYGEPIEVYRRVANQLEELVDGVLARLGEEAVI